MDRENNQLGKSFDFWYSINERNINSNYENALRTIASFDTIDKFWQIYSYMSRPDEFHQNIEYHIFSEGVKPMWEDEANKNGARWLLRIKKGSANEFWEELVLTFIGGRFGLAENYINGIVCSTRKHEDILAIWLRGPCD
jgi:translation initiation factor 4E